MEVILNKDVENLGFKYDLVEVKNGYGRNYLIPQGYAHLATPSAKKVLAETLKQKAHKEQKEVTEAQELAGKLGADVLKIEAKVGEGNKLFGSVTNADLVEVFSKQGVVLDKKFISVPGNTIKRAGQYEAKVRFHRQVVKNIAFEVVGVK